MEDKFLNLCCAIVEDESFTLYSAIADFFKKYGYNDGYINTLQAIYDLTRNNSYLLKIADYFKDNGHNDIANLYYNKYFKIRDRNLYEKIEQTKPYNNPLPDIRAQFENEAALVKLIDKNVLLVHLLHFGLDYGLVDMVLDLSENLFIIADKINKYLSISNTNCARSVYDIKEIVDDYNFLSNSLAKIRHHNDINRLAIKLNPNNKLPYFNIMDDFIVYNNPQAAIDFYNDVFIKQFGWYQELELKQISRLYSTLKNGFIEIGDYYKVVYYQKLIIESGLKV